MRPPVATVVRSEAAVAFLPAFGVEELFRDGRRARTRRSVEGAHDVRFLFRQFQQRPPGRVVVHIEGIGIFRIEANSRRFRRN